jgi:hypothetical protein
VEKREEMIIRVLSQGLKGKRREMKSSSSSWSRVYLRYLDL